MFIQTVYLPVIGLVDPKDLSPGDLVGVHKDSYLILEKLPDEYDVATIFFSIMQHTTNTRTTHVNELGMTLV